MIPNLQKCGIKALNLPIKQENNPISGFYQLKTLITLIF
jgi:hypothetical protein